MNSLQMGCLLKKCLPERFIKGLGWYMDYAFINGTGEGQPLGIINDPALITVDKEDSQAAATITYQNVVNMFQGLLRPVLPMRYGLPIHR